MRICERIFIQKRLIGLETAFITISSRSDLVSARKQCATAELQKSHDQEENFAQSIQRLKDAANFGYFLHNLNEKLTRKNFFNFLFKIKFSNLMRLCERKWEGKYRETKALNKAKMEFFEAKNSDILKNYEISKSESERLKLEKEKLNQRIEELRSLTVNQDSDLARRESEHKTTISQLRKDLKTQTDSLNILRGENDTLKTSAGSTLDSFAEQEKRLSQQIVILKNKHKNMDDDKLELVKKLTESFESINLLKKEYEKLQGTNERLEKCVRDKDDCLKEKDLILKEKKSEDASRSKERDEYMVFFLRVGVFRKPIFFLMTTKINELTLMISKSIKIPK
jgi:hypothetical protein